VARYLVTRILWMIPVLWLVATVTFVLMHSAPGSPWDAKSGASGRDLDASLQGSFNRKYGLDEPIFVQYLTYLKNAVTLDFGESFVKQDKPVIEVIGDGFPYSARIGIPIGILAATRHNTAVDYVSLFFTTVSYTLPDFVIAIFLLIIFSVQLGLMPVLFTDWRSYILPALALGTGSAAFIARLTRSSVLEAMRNDYVTTARAKGLSSRAVMSRHVVRNAMIPVITVIGPAFAGLITGTIIIERVFGVPGMGHLYIDSINNRDYPVIMGTTLFYAFFITFANLLVDIAYGFTDPRIRESR
jgi:ABC-type dipeptide/oligopeptide/nickel transport system permease component